MKTKAAVVHGPGEKWQITELDLDPPRMGEVQLRMVASGLCHTDDHIRTGEFAPRFPLVGGHEGAGIVEEVGPGVARLSPGDHVVTSFLPVCGRCRFCAMGKSNLCDLGAGLMDGAMPDGTYRFHRDGEDYAGFCMLGTFAERTVVSETSCVKIDKDVDLTTAVLLGCGVVTGWGSAVHAGQTRPGDTVIIYGVGGIGMNAVQGACHAGAEIVIAVDPIDHKRVKAKDFGATHTAASAGEAFAIAQQVTRGVGADVAVVTVGVVTPEVVSDAFNAIRKAGTVVVTGAAGMMETTIQLPGTILMLFEKRIQGAVFGSGNPFNDIPRLLDYYRAGRLKLDELVTARYTLEQVNEGYSDLLAGRNIRGVIEYGGSDQ